MFVSTKKDTLSPTTLRNQKENTFSDFYDQYAPAVYGFIKKILLNEEVSKQVLATVIKKSWQSIPEFERSNLSVLCQVLRIARKEANKQRINIALKQIFTTEKSNVVTTV
jgi:RNA polymerase sigma-70 factor (ECF subfamily)